MRVNQRQKANRCSLNLEIEIRISKFSLFILLPFQVTSAIYHSALTKPSSRCHLQLKASILPFIELSSRTTRPHLLSGSWCYINGVISIIYCLASAHHVISNSETSLLSRQSRCPNSCCWVGMLNLVDSNTLDPADGSFGISVCLGGYRTDETTIHCIWFGWPSSDSAIWRGHLEPRFARRWRSLCERKIQ